VPRNPRAFVARAGRRGVGTSGAFRFPGEPGEDGAATVMATWTHRNLRVGSFLLLVGAAAWPSARGARHDRPVVAAATAPHLVVPTGATDRSTHPRTARVVTARLEAAEH
jgi:hypothetical protein